ncbi:MAG: hypothetical protein H0T45_07265 [Pyrinomonadaceae bacterium]|nr:hypothetical protein [Pyrinomonadaceae bacterium]
MGSTSTAKFRKGQTCPSADLLVRYGQASVPLDTCREVSAHLSNCDFCGAEWQLLVKHPPAAMKLEDSPAKIPPHLYRLAIEMLMKTIRTGKASAARDFERSKLTLTDA